MMNLQRWIPIVVGAAAVLNGCKKETENTSPRDSHPLVSDVTPGNPIDPNALDENGLPKALLSAKQVKDILDTLLNGRKGVILKLAGSGEKGEDTQVVYLTRLESGYDIYSDSSDGSVSTRLVFDTLGNYNPHSSRITQTEASTNKWKLQTSGSGVEIPTDPAHLMVMSLGAFAKEHP